MQGFGRSIIFSERIIFDTDISKFPSTKDDKHKPPKISSRQVIGEWRVVRKFYESDIIIYRQNGKIFIEQKFLDGSKLKKELIEISTPNGNRFEYKEGSSNGDHFRIDIQGNLELRDNDGLITTAGKMN